MNMATKHGVLQAHLEEWLACKGDKGKRRSLTTQLAQSLHLHEKSIARSMRRLQMKSASATEKRGRPEIYGADVSAALCTVWEAMEYPCAENMPRESIDEYVSHFLAARTWDFSDGVTDRVLAMSTGTKKLRIAGFRKKRGLLRGRSATIASPRPVHYGTQRPSQALFAQGATVVMPRLRLSSCPAPQK